MKIFEALLLKFESPKWVNDPELGLPVMSSIQWMMQHLIFHIPTMMIQ
jgi:hypothetical protein